MRYMRRIAPEVFIGVTQLFNYYLYEVYNLFSSISPPGQFDGMKGTIGTLGRVASSMSITTAPTSVDTEKIVLMEKPEYALPTTLSSYVNIYNATNLFGLHIRAVASDSLIFLSEALKKAQPEIMKLLPAGHVAIEAELFFTSRVGLAPVIRSYLIKVISFPLASSLERLPEMIEKVNWEVPPDSRPFSQFTIKEVKSVETKAEAILKAGNISIESYQELFEYIGLYIMDLLLDGFTRIKKCSLDGRTMMVMDFQLICSVLEKITNKKPFPGSPVVNSLLKASYLGEKEFVDFCKKQTELTGKHLLSAFSCGCGANMKKNERPIAEDVIQEISKNRIKRSFGYSHLKSIYSQYVTSEASQIAKHGSFFSLRKTADFLSSAVSSANLLRKTDTSFTPPPPSPSPHFDYSGSDGASSLSVQSQSAPLTSPSPRISTEQTRKSQDLMRNSQDQPRKSQDSQRPAQDARRTSQEQARKSQDQQREQTRTAEGTPAKVPSSSPKVSTPNLITRGAKTPQEQDRADFEKIANVAKATTKALSSFMKFLDKPDSSQKPK
eukprot:TRINITY_DN1477_c1_g1_i1.p1 TRINITY_DN1477_c1_g1~~TRINITY_DN1477_c1_g1_i1.p1  ORF type:complete len:587 (-),score=177.49 TRINITY_DN1477_c1_g1_i1:19-1674(-)